MANLDHVRLAHALAKAYVQPGISDDTVEQCIYQIGIVLATHDPGFDLRSWRRLITKHQVSLRRLDETTSIRRAQLAQRVGRRGRQ